MKKCFATEQTRLEKARVLVHCMSGQNRSGSLLGSLYITFRIRGLVFVDVLIMSSIRICCRSSVFEVAMLQEPVFEVDGSSLKYACSRSPAVVIAYLMRYKGWRLPQCYQWVKDRRPSINLSEGALVNLSAFSLCIVF